MTTNHDITLEVGGHELVCNVDLTPYDPGNTSGPPERCYPPEGGDMSVNSIRLRLKPGKTDDCFMEISDLLLDLDALDRVTALLDDEIEKLLAEPPEPPEPEPYDRDNAFYP